MYNMICRFDSALFGPIELFADPTAPEYGSSLKFYTGGRAYSLDLKRWLGIGDGVAALGYVAAALNVIKRGHNMLEQQVWTTTGPNYGRVHKVVIKANECYVDGVTGITDFRVRELPDAELTFREEVCPDCGVNLTQSFDWGCYVE